MTHADLVDAGDGVHAAIARPDRLAVGNAAVVDLGEQTLVVDTHISYAAARELKAAAEELTGRPASLVLNTHWHADHVLGNEQFAGSTIVSTARTRERGARSAWTTKALRRRGPSCSRTGSSSGI